MVGFALAARPGAAAPVTWADFFAIGSTFPGQVAVPDDPAIVVGAALVATGHDWNSAAASDLDDARSLLMPLRSSLVIGGSVDSGRLDGGLAVLCTGLGFREPGHGVRFVVPSEGTIARPRLLCIPPYAPDPLTAARDTERTGRATPVGEASFALAPGLLANPAVYPPALPPVTLGFADTTPAGLEARADIWHDMTTPAAGR